MFRHAVLNEMSLGGKLKGIPEDPIPVEEIIKKVKQTGREGITDFQKLFFCFRWASSSDLIVLNLLTDAICEGHLGIEVEFITIPPNVRWTFEAVGHRGRTVESAEHQGMKSWVEEFLGSKGIPSVEETPLLGFEIDVGSVKEKVFVECGDTEPSKIFSLIFSGHSIGVLQYNSESIVWFHPGQSFRLRFSRYAFDYFGLGDRNSA